MRLWTPHETPSMLCGSSWSAAAVAAEAPQQRMRWSGGEAAAAAAPGDNQRRQREQQLQPAHGITSLEKRGPLTQICRMPPLKAAAPPATLPEDDQDSDASEEMSDPEDDIVEDEAEFECVRDAARDRVAPRTRDKYDLFIGLMKAFFLSQRDLQCEVVENQCKLPLSITAVGRYLGHVEAKTREYSPGKFKPVSPSYYRAVVQSIHDLYICNQQGVDESLRLLMFSRQKTYIRRIAQMKATGTYPIAPSRCISGEGYKLLCESLAKAEPAEEGGWAWHLVSCIWSYVVLLWCLLARCDRVAQLRWADFSWTGDALTVFIQKSKSDQAGDRAYHKKLYTSNTPATCPVLALSVLFFSREMSQRSEFIFPRADTRRAGLRQLSRLVRLFFPESQFASFGCNPHEIAWHHFKRGGMTFLSSKMDGPSHVAVKMRAHASPRPLDEVLRDHMATLQNSEATGAAAVIHRDLQASLTKDQRFGYLQTHEHWPQPSNGWIVGAVQCAKCVSCDKYWATDKSIRAHLLQHMTAAQREVHFRAHNAGTWVYTAPSTKWCVAVTPPGNAHSKYVPVQFQAAQHRKQSVHAPPAQPVASSPAQLLLPVQAAVASSERPAAVQLLPPPGDERLKCCCGETFQNISTLRKHHNGIGGKRPRDQLC